MLAADYLVSRMLPRKIRPLYMGAKLVGRTMGRARRATPAPTAAPRQPISTAPEPTRAPQVVRSSDKKGAAVGVYDPIRGRNIYRMSPGHTRSTLRKALAGDMSVQKALQECGVVAKDHPQLVAEIANSIQRLESMKAAGDRRGYRKEMKRSLGEAERAAIRHRHPAAASFTFAFR